MKKLQHIILGLAVISMGLLTSCKEETNTNTEAATPAPTTTGEAQNTEQPATAQVNPQHGLPGHRCDIPVGAPLNADASTQMQQTSTPASTQSSTVSPIRVDQSPNVNPPHGQPGHDCSIPVGAELKQQ